MQQPTLQLSTGGRGGGGMRESSCSTMTKDQPDGSRGGRDGNAHPSHTPLMALGGVTNDI